MPRKLRALLALLLGTPFITVDHRRRWRRFAFWLERLKECAAGAHFHVTIPLDMANTCKLSLHEASTLATAHPGAGTIVVPAGTHYPALTGADHPNVAGSFDASGSTLSHVFER